MAQSPTSLSAAAGFLGLRRSIVGLLGVVILVGMGEKMAERFLPIYLMALGGGALAIGLLNGLDNLLSALYSLPGGWLAHRIGTRRSLSVFNVMAMAGFAIVIAIPSWTAVIAGAVLFISWTAISLPATMGLVARVLPRNKRTMGVSMHSLVRRIPMALGPLIGGLFIDHWGEKTGVRLAFAAALAMAALAILLQQRFIEPDPERRPSSGEADDEANHRRGPGTPGRRAITGETPVPQSATPDRPGEGRILGDLTPALRNLLVSDVLVRFCEQIPYAFVVVWCMKSVRCPVNAFQFGLLTTIEMAIAVLVYIPVAYLADRSGKKPFVVMTFAFFTLFPLVLLYSQSFWVLAGAFVIRGLKEFGEPTRKALIMDLAPEHRKEVTFGLYYLIRDSIVAVAAFGGAFLWEVSPAANFLAAFAFGAVGTIWFAVRGTDLPVQR